MLHGTWSMHSTNDLQELVVKASLWPLPSFIDLYDLNDFGTRDDGGNQVLHPVHIHSTAHMHITARSGVPSRPVLCASMTSWCGTHSVSIPPGRAAPRWLSWLIPLVEGDCVAREGELPSVHSLGLFVAGLCSQQRGWWNTW